MEMAIPLRVTGAGVSSVAGALPGHSSSLLTTEPESEQQSERILK